MIQTAWFMIKSHPLQIFYSNRLAPKIWSITYRHPEHGYQSSYLGIENTSVLKYILEHDKRSFLTISPRIWDSWAAFFKMKNGNELILPMIP